MIVNKGSLLAPDDERLTIVNKRTNFIKTVVFEKKTLPNVVLYEGKKLWGSQNFLVFSLKLLNDKY